MMRTVFIGRTALLLKPRPGEQPGDPMTAEHVNILGAILHNRVKARLRYMLERGDILPAELQAKADELCAQPLSAYPLFENDSDDPIHSEAMEIARTLITQKMAEERLPPPKNLDTHAKQLVDAVPAIIEKARQRLEARYRAAEDLLA